MAELQGGSGVLVPTGSAAGVRDLLPYELQLCEFAGITPEEYLYFQRLSDAYNGKRSEEYEHIPDAQNGFLIPILINLVIGIAISAIGALLAPKPKAPEAPQTPPQLKTADATGASRFTSTNGFDSVQQLASLGETVPLVFANRNGNVGGIRVKALLLWSQLLSQQVGQQLKALMLLSAGELAASPEFAGYAIGDQTLKNYTTAKVGLYRRLNGGRVTESDRYSEGTISASPSADVFSVYDDASEAYKPWFSGARSTSTQTEFGCFNPMVNATPYRLPYELILIGKDMDQALKDDAARKRAKIDRDYLTRAAITSANSNTVVYTITGGQDPADAYGPWGLDDVNAAVEDLRVVADDNIQIGSLYMAGSAQVICTAASAEKIWELGKSKTYTFRVEEPGEVSTFNPEAGGNSTSGWVLQRLAIGTVSNNRACNITEIGIKSTVWKQITGFPNVNSQPDSSTIAYYESKNGSIQLGSTQRYHRRISFFRMQVRPLGLTNAAWKALDGGKLFAVEGSTLQPHYNYIRVVHPFGQYEFRFVPVPGAEVIAKWRGRSVYFLGGGSLQRFARDEFIVTFTGYTKVLQPSLLNNTDWIVGATPAQFVGAVQSISPLAAGSAKPTQIVQVERYERSAPYRFAWFDVRAIGGRVDVYWDSQLYTGTRQQINDLGFYRGNYQGPQAYAVIGPITTVQEPVGSGVFTGTGGSGSGMSVRVTAWSNDYREFALVDGGKGYLDKEAITVSAFGGSYTLTIRTDEQIFANRPNLNPFDAVNDIKRYDAERTSHMEGPEHSIVYVNEQVTQVPPQYENLALVGLRLNANKEWSSFQQLSAYVQKGVKVERLIDDNGNPTSGLVAPTNNLAEIVYAMLTDRRLGAGDAIGKQAVDRQRMTIAAQFCRANGFTWDGVLAERLNLRNWIFEQASYCLLDFTILGGQFSLMPSVPFSGDYRIDPTAKVKISALFTDGNIRNLKVSWLSPEERQLFKAVVKWRQEQLNGFSQERMFTIRLSDGQGGRDDDPEEQFDLSGFCTTQQQGLTFAKYALKLRKEVDHALTFETTPQAAMGLEPGQYFRLVSEVTHTSRFNNGVINSEGTVVSTTGLADGNHAILYWVPGTTEVQEATVTVSGGVAQQAALRGVVFTLKNTTTTSKIYKVETLSYTEDGFVEVAGSYQPTTASGTLSTLQWANADFVIETG